MIWSAVERLKSSGSSGPRRRSRRRIASVSTNAASRSPGLRPHVEHGRLGLGEAPLGRAERDEDDAVVAVLPEEAALAGRLDAHHRPALPGEEEAPAEGGTAPEEGSRHVGAEHGHPRSGPRLEPREGAPLRELGPHDVEVVVGDTLDEDAVRLALSGPRDQGAPVHHRRHDELDPHVADVASLARDHLRERRLEGQAAGLPLGRRGVGVAAAVVGEDVVRAELAEEEGHGVAHVGEDGGHEHDGDDADHDAEHGEDRAQGVRRHRVVGPAHGLESEVPPSPEAAVGPSQRAHSALTAAMTSIRDALRAG